MTSTFSLARLMDHLSWRDDVVLKEQVTLVWRNMPVALIASILTALVQVWFMWPHVAHRACIAWFAANSLSVAIVYSIKKISTERFDLRKQAWAQIICMSLLGLSWGGSIAVSAANGTALAMAYSLLVVGGVNSGALGICGALLPAALAYLLAMSGALLLGVLLFADPSFTPFVILMALYLVISLVQAANTQEAAERSIVLKLQNVDLVDKLRYESEQARKAQEAAETANKDKSKFLAAASHDLRQPLHAMGLFIDALGSSVLNVEQKKVLTHLHAASNATSEMLNTLLDYSRLEAGVVQSKPKSFLLQRMLSNLNNEFSPQAAEKRLSYRSRKTELAALADPTLVELVLRNLISNALRYTSQGGVLVACRKRGEKIVIRVWDTGLGIAPEDQHIIFKEFYQLANPERDRQNGLGLGLAIVRRLCDAMKVQIHLRSILGKGSMFELMLPLYPGFIKSEAAPASIDNWAGLRVMVIDDEAAVRHAMQSLLASWGCIHTCFESAQDALDDLTRSADHDLPQVVISDYRLRGGLTGAHAIAQVREAMHLRSMTSKLPAIIITGDTAPERIREAQATDALLLHKPVSAQALSAALAQIQPAVRIEC